MSNLRQSTVMPELLAPAGSFEKLETAIHYGADAVYMGGQHYGLRAKAKNFDENELKEAIAYGHGHGVKIYVTVNIFAHNKDFEGLDHYLKSLESFGADGVIVSDPGILMMAKETIPHVPIHLSTQANVTNGQSARFWSAQGVRRLNLARELGYDEIVAIRAATNAELEVFVHGALCISYSGRCMLSTYLTGRDANHGNCAHPCRYSFTLIEEKRPGERFKVVEDDRGTYLFNSKDLCLLKKLPMLMGIGINSLKIEGRMKSIFYVGGVVRVYRAVLDYLSTLETTQWDNPTNIELPVEFLQEIERLGTRGTTENFFDGPPDETDMLYESSRHEQPYEPVAVVRDAGDPPLVEVRNVLRSDEKIEYMDSGVRTVTLQLSAMFDQTGKKLTRANPGNLVRIEFTSSTEIFTQNGIFRRRKEP
ncbi:MAG: U32 family peptidase [Desulfobulbaceae bacterium]|nr:MAG: U32 family peptidase [Desulfobulbaceae bacterium]